MTIAQDEKLKAFCHGLLTGCLLPIFAYNVGAKKWRNVAIYGGMLAYEAAMIYDHVKDTSSTTMAEVRL